MELKNKLWMMKHRRFEEMCALAITGQLGGSQMCELDEHIAVCKLCRNSLESTAQFSLQAMPLLAEKHRPIAGHLPPDGIRDRFLERLSLEMVGATNETRLRPFRSLDGGTKDNLSTPRRASSVSVDRCAEAIAPNTTIYSSFWHSVVVTVACLGIAICAYFAGALKHETVQSSPPQTSAVPSVPSLARVLESEPAGESDRVRGLKLQQAQLETKLARMQQDLTSADLEREALKAELTDAKAKLVTATQIAVSSSQTLENDTSSTLQAQVDHLSERLAESDVRFSVQKQTNDELAAKLEMTTAELRRERDEKSARTELGDVVAARNLHIVDVYDADPSGKRQRSFGRVFYIEGKSLVFYAYDLNDPGQFKASVVFHVWGGKVGVKEVTHSLGILRKDDVSQNRWAMTFDDPNVLSQINSVFVTAEAPNKQDGEPHGKKVLYAYFGSQPNHP